MSTGTDCIPGQVSAHFWTPSTSCALRGDLGRGWVAGGGPPVPRRSAVSRAP